MISWDWLVFMISCLAFTGVLFKLEISSLSPELFYRRNQLIFCSTSHIWVEKIRGQGCLILIQTSKVFGKEVNVCKGHGWNGWKTFCTKVSCLEKGQRIDFLQRRLYHQHLSRFLLKIRIEHWWKGQEWDGQGPDVHLQVEPSSSERQPALSVRPPEPPDQLPGRRKVFGEPKTLFVGQTTIIIM